MPIDLVEKIQQELFQLQDLPYKDFNSKLVPNISPDTMIGIRIPVLRQYAKEFLKESQLEAMTFLQQLPHDYFEENHLHGFFIESIKDIQESLRQTEAFLPYIDNWATCDIFSPKIFKKNPEIVYEKIRQWIQSDHPYTARYAIGLLLGNYLDQEFMPKHLALVSQVQSQDYYLRMMVAWYFATALSKQYEAAIPYITEQRLEPWVHNKTIQKATESRRIADDTKTYLRSLKVSRV